MPDNHPQIQLLSNPDYACSNAAYNCVEFCMQSDDFEDQAGVVADGALVIFTPSTQAAGLEFTIAGITFETSTVTTGNTVDWSGTNADIANNLEVMLNANFFFSRDYTFTRGQIGVIEFFLIEAKEVGFNANFTFDLTNLVGGLQIGFFNTQGTDQVFKPNYQMIVELWQASAGIPESILTTRSYQFKESDLQVCFDLRRLIQPFLQSQFPELLNNINPVLDTSYGQFAIRYGQAFSTDQCTLQPQYFEFSSVFDVINAAIQRDEDPQDLSPYCTVSVPNVQFLTNSPEDYRYCKDNYIWLSALISQDLVDAADAASVDIAPVYIVTFSDASTEVVAGPILNSGAGIYHLPIGVPQIQSSLVSTNPNIVSIDLSIILFSLIVPPTIIFPLRSIDVSGRCCRYELYFLNTKGGWDTMLFTDADSLTVNIESLEVKQVEPCFNEIDKGGRGQFSKVSTDTISVFSDFVDTYESIEWFKQMLNSPSKLLHIDGKAYKVNLTNDSVLLRQYAERVLAQLDFVISFDNNQQENLL